MQQYQTDKIKVLSLILIIIVLYIHSGFHENEIQGMALNHYVQDFISGKLERLAVPLFYIISGYLFFINSQKGFNEIKRKIRSRFFTLFVPYLYGCVFFVLFFAFVKLIPNTAGFINSNFDNYISVSSFEILKSIFGVAGESNSPLAFQLWFLRDLILIIAISPLLYLFLPRLKWFGILLLYLIVLFDIYNKSNLYPYLPRSIFSSVFYFSLGGTIYLSKITIEKNKGLYIGSLVIIAFIIFSLFELLLNYNIPKDYSVIITLWGIVGVWMSYDTIVKRNFSLDDSPYLRKVCNFTFFIYLFHEPTLNIVRKIIVLLIGKNSTGFLISYLVSPFIFTVIAVFVGNLIKLKIPIVYKSLVGGRA